MSTIAVSGRVNILLAVADHLAKNWGYDPERHAVGLAKYWTEAEAEERVSLAVVHAGMRPDEIVLKQFLEALQGRAERVAGVP